MPTISKIVAPKNTTTLNLLTETLTKKYIIIHVF